MSERDVVVVEELSSWLYQCPRSEMYKPIRSALGMKVKVVAMSRLLILFISRSNKGDGGGNRRSPDADQIGYRMYIGQASEVYIHPRAGSQSRDIIYTRSVLSAMIMLYIIVPLLVTCTES